MRKESSDCVLTVFLILASILLPGCNAPVTRSDTAPVTTKTESVPQAQANESPRVTEPIATGENYPEALRQAWRRFTASGQYQLAQKEDIRVPSVPYVYLWGDLAYGKRAEDDHLAAIVVDTTRNDKNRFGLVIFSPPKGSRDYQVHWLYRDRDLSSTSVSRASGSFFVTEHLEDGTRRTCIVHWYRSRKQFECKQPGVVS